jgi:CheY-like chemotaxis protein
MQRVHPATTRDNLSFECPPQLVGLRVLIVDDEADTRDLLRAVMERCGCEATSVGSAAEALATLQQTNPDVLISDIGMPEEDGYTFIRKVRALPAERGGNTPAIALTAYARAEDRVRTLMAGFQVHVPKPIEPIELAAVVASLTRRNG